jgi:hypothetical protein
MGFNSAFKELKEYMEEVLTLEDGRIGCPEK